MRLLDVRHCCGGDTPDELCRIQSGYSWAIKQNRKYTRVDIQWPECRDMARNVRLMLHPSSVLSESQFSKHVSELNSHGGLWSVGLIRKRLQHLEQASTVPFTCRRHKLGEHGTEGLKSLGMVDSSQVF
jgi:hypothetical protein